LNQIDLKGLKQKRLEKKMVTDRTWKVLLIGYSDSGKFKIIKRWKKDYINGIIRPDRRKNLMMGVHFFIKIIEKENLKHKLQLWDFEEEEKYRFLLPTYCLGANITRSFNLIMRSKSSR